MQLHGTALPSLALEYLQEVEDLKLSRSDQEKAEETIAEVLASLYSGTYRGSTSDWIRRLNRSPFSTTAGADTVSRRTTNLKSIQTYEPERHPSDRYGHQVVSHCHVALSRHTEEGP